MNDENPFRAPALLLFNANIHTADSAFSRVSVLAAANGRVVYTGNSRREAAALLPPDAERLDLEGKTAIPGLIDSHLHLLTQGQRLSEIDIFLKSKEEILRIVALEAQKLGQGRWIVGRGWNHETWSENRWPRKEDLDAAAPDNPVVLTRADAHSVWANTQALRAAGFDRDSPDLPGGEILRAPDGDLLGILVDTPIFKIWQAVPPLDEAQRLAAYQKAQAELFGCGITSAGDAWQTMKEHATLKTALDAGELKLRVYGMLGSLDALDRRRLEEGLRPLRGLCGGRLSLNAFKVVLDGSLGSRSAWLTGDYADRPGHRGAGRYSDEALYELIRPALRRGFQICAHAIGDAAVLQAIRVLEKASGEFAIRQGRHRIEHFQIVSPEDAVRALSLGIIPSMETIHEATDKKMAAIRLGPEALAKSYPWREVLDQGGIIANGSDSPMDLVNPFLGMHAALSRTGFSAAGGGTAASESLRLTRAEALKSYTSWAAAAEFAEHLKGSLEPDKLADIAVLDRDIMSCPVDEIKDTKVLLTILGGETVYRSL